jgi:asparagine synthetase B (glutamine-hydrolysing)
MIFDFILFHTSDRNSGTENNYNFRSTLSKLPIYEKVRANYFDYSNDNWKVYGLGREVYKEQVSIGEFVNIFIIGECFSRIDSNYFNGNSRKLIAGDIRKLFLEKEDGLVNEIKGNFQIVICDEREKIIKVANSKGGISPFYHYYTNEVFICATAIYLFPEKVKSKLTFSKANLLEYALFNYPLGDNTLLQDVYNLLPGEIISYKNGSVNKKKYYDVSDLITNKRITKEEAIEKGAYLFNKIVNTLASDKEKINASLTGGFDGRAILSALRVDKNNLLLYSFGIKGSQNISIPIEIATDLGYNFKPYYLEEEYAEAFPYYASMTCLLTDCLATVQRANYLYVFEDLAKHSDVVLTGLFGSELMRTFQNAGLMISIPAINILLSDDPLKKLSEEIDNYPHREYWGEQIFNNDTKEEAIESWREKYIDKKYNSINQFVFTYFIKDALRKYFGGEVHVERLFAANRFPFFDDEFVEMILQSPFSAINNTFLKPTIKERLNSQIYYAHLIQKNKPELLNYTTDHGFAPKYLFYHLSALFVGSQVYAGSRLKKWKKYKEFNSEVWAETLFLAKRRILEKESILNTKLLLKKIENREWRNIPEETKKLFSVQLFVGNVEKKN